MGLLDSVGGFIKDAGDGIAHAAGNGYKAAIDAWNTAVEDAKAGANVVGTAVRDADTKKEQLGAWIDSKAQQIQPTGSSSLPQVTHAQFAQPQIKERRLEGKISDDPKKAQDGKNAGKPPDTTLQTVLTNPGMKNVGNPPSEADLKTYYSKNGPAHE